MSNNEKIEFFANEYNHQDWKAYSRCFRETEIPEKLLDIMPDDIIRPLLYLLGDDYTQIWINKEIKALDNQKPVELVKTDIGRRALKEFVMRMHC